VQHVRNRDRSHPVGLKGVKDLVAAGTLDGDHVPGPGDGADARLTKKPDFGRERTEPCRSSQR
jgi:hypothetical protein